tara:strand:- start:3587 stop:3970 length:384 start_codon:yes stop_codon:yes gene_type:complete
MDYKELASDTKKMLRDEIRVLKFRNEKLHGFIKIMRDEYQTDIQDLNNQHDQELKELQEELKSLKRKYVPDLETISGIKEQVPENDIKVMDKKKRESYARRWEKNDKKGRYSDEWIRKNILENKDLT